VRSPLSIISDRDYSITFDQATPGLDGVRRVDLCFFTLMEQDPCPRRSIDGEDSMAIKRVWHGWTTPENADTYQHHLHKEVFPEIEAKNIPGYSSIELFRRDIGNEVEFVTVMTFESLKNVIDFQGRDYERCYVPDTARRLLKRWDEVSAHYEAIEIRKYG
jgi:hypothetical protein